MITDSNRTSDEFGYLTVENCVLTGEDVAKYFGYEIPFCKQLGLNEKDIYNVYRPKDEIKDSNFSNKPLLSRHADFSSEDYKYKLIVGTIGETRLDTDEIKGTVVFWDKKAIEELERGKKFLSCGYMYEPVVKKGFYNNSSYDIKMTNIVANHVAMVDNPRYKPAIVADEDLNLQEGKSMIFNKKKPLTQDASKEKEWSFDSDMKACMDKDMSEEEKEEKLKNIKEKMKEKEAKDKMSKDKLKVRDKAKDDEMEDIAGINPAGDEDLEDKDQEKNDEETSGTSAKKKKMTGDYDINIKKLVADSVAKEIDKIHKKTISFDSAIREYERIYGRVNRMAFDSADNILDTILKNDRRNIEGKTFEQKQAMVEMMDSRKNNVQTNLTMDSVSSSKNHTPSNILDFIKKKVG